MITVEAKHAHENKNTIYLLKYQIKNYPSTVRFIAIDIIFKYYNIYH